MAVSFLSAQRLHDAVAAVCPILGVSIGTLGDSSSVRVRFASGATADQQTAANAVVTGFDWSEAAQSAWEVARNATTAKSIVDNPTGDPTPLAAGGADLAILVNVNEVRALVNKLKAAVNTLAPGAITDADLPIVDPTGQGPSYVKAGIDTLAGQ